MALAAYEMLGPLNLDQRYDLGRVGEVAGDTALARAQADTILAQRSDAPPRPRPRARAPRSWRGDAARARALRRAARSPPSRPNARALPEYLLHQNDIDALATLAK